MRTLIARLREAFEKLTWWRPGEPVPLPPREKTADPLQMYLTDIFTVSANLAGLPGISVPCGFAGDRLPVGLQLTGKMFDEETLLCVADAYERATDWHKQTPPI